MKPRYKIQASAFHVFLFLFVQDVNNPTGAPASCRIQEPVYYVTPGEPVAIVVLRENPVSSAEVNFRMEDRTAAAGIDYEQRGGPVLFTDSLYTSTITIPTFASSNVAGKEFAFILEPVTNALLGSNSTAIVRFRTRAWFEATNYVLSAEGRLQGRILLERAFPEPAELSLDFGPRRISVPAGRVEITFEAQLYIAGPIRMSIRTGGPIVSDSVATILPHAHVPGEIVLRATRATVPGGTFGNLVIARGPPLDSRLVVHYAPGGTAVTGGDYPAQGGTLEFEPWQSTASILIKAPLLPHKEPREITFAFSATNHTVLVMGEAAVDIVPYPSIRFSAPSFKVENEAFINVRYTNGPPAVPFRYYTRDGSARTGRDYLPVEGSVTNESASGEIIIPLVDNGRVEPVRDFELVAETLSAPHETNSVIMRIGDNETALDASVRVPLARQPSTPIFAGGVRPDGKIVTLTTGGSLFTFNTNGVIESEIPVLPRNTGWSAAFQSDGSLIAAPDTSVAGLGKLVRVRPDGSTDSQFQSESLHASGVPAALKIDEQNRIYAAAWLWAGGVGVFRLLPNGAMDNSFVPYISYDESRIERIIPRSEEEMDLYVENWSAPWYDDFEFEHPNYDRIRVRRGERIFTEPYALRPFPNTSAGPPFDYVSDIHGRLMRKFPDGEFDPSFITSGWVPLIHLGALPDKKSVAFLLLWYEQATLVLFPMVTDLSKTVFGIGSWGSREGPNAIASVIVGRSGDSSAEERFIVRTRDHTAKAGHDYVALSTNIHFAPFQNVLEVPVPLLDDLEVEPPPIEFWADLLSVTGETIMSNAIMIEDDEPGVFLRILRTPQGLRIILANSSGNRYALVASDELTGFWTTIANCYPGETIDVTREFTGRGMFFRARLDAIGP